MFVRNLTSEELVYRKPRLELRFSPYRVKYVDDTLVSISTLKEVFGEKVLIFSLKQEKSEIKNLAKKVTEELPVEIKVEKVVEENSSIPEVKEVEEVVVSNKEAEKKIDEALEEVKKETEAKVQAAIKEAEEQPVEEKKVKKSRTRKTTRSRKATSKKSE